MTRAALLPTPGDPFVLLMWFRFFERVWQDEVDKLYIHINGPLEPQIKESLIKIVTQNPKVIVSNDDQMIDHGNAIRKLLSSCNEDLVVLMEDDAPTFEKGAIDAMFKKIEGGGIDAVVSPRGCTSAAVINAIDRQFSLGDDATPNFWPSFGFFKRMDLLKTDQNFGAILWKTGTYIKEIDYTVTEDTCGDTFVWASIQLRAMGLRFYSVEQYHRAPESFKHKNLKIGVFDGKAPWIHIGSLSGMVYNVLIRGNHLPVTGDDNLKVEYMGRVFWLLMALKYTTGYWDNVLKEFSEKYNDGVNYFIEGMGLKRSFIRDMILMYEELLAKAL